jgi:hypothetical protein
MVAGALIGGAMLGGAAANYFGNEEARRASEKAAKDAAYQREEAKKYLQSIDPNQLAALDTESLNSLLNIASGLNYTPEEYQYIEGATPLDYQYVGDAASQQVADSPEARAIQLAALQDLQKRASEGLTAQDQADFMRAQTQSGEMAKGREQAIMQSLQARGMGGSGIEAALRGQASQAGASNLAQILADKAAANANQRTNATQASMTGAASLRGQDIGLNTTNANIMNQFALENSKRRQEILNANTQSKNRALDDRTAEQRRIAGLNTGSKNEAQRYNNDLQMRSRESQNQNLQNQVNARNAKLEALYSAQDSKAKGLANAQLGGVSDAWASGAANADYQRNKYGTFADLGNAYGNYAMQDEYMNKRYPEKETK